MKLKDAMNTSTGQPYRWPEKPHAKAHYDQLSSAIDVVLVMMAMLCLTADWRRRTR